MNRTTRIVAVTVGLLAAGALAGALAADAALLLASAVDGSGLALTNWEPLLVVAGIGALFGGVLLPITAWLFLRRVPLGLALLGTVVGTIVGGALGWIVRLGSNEIQGGIMGAFAGFAVAALFLRLRASAPRVRHAVPTRG
jgi:hypothetical protein